MLRKLFYERRDFFYVRRDFFYVAAVFRLPRRSLFRQPSAAPSPLAHRLAA